MEPFMNSKVRINQYPYVFGIGFPIVISQVFEYSKKNNYIAEVYIIEANYNRESKFALKEYVDVHKLLESIKDAETTLDIVLDVVLNKYQMSLYEKKNDLINKVLPLQELNTKFSSNVIALLPNAADIIWGISSRTDSEEIREFIKNITPIKLDFKSE